MNISFLRPNAPVFFLFESLIFKNGLFVLSHYVFWVALGLMQIFESLRLVVFSSFNLGVLELISFYPSQNFGYFLTVPFVFLIIQSFAVSGFQCFLSKWFVNSRPHLLSRLLLRSYFFLLRRTFFRFTILPLFRHFAWNLFDFCRLVSLFSHSAKSEF